MSPQGQVLCWTLFSPTKEGLVGNAQLKGSLGCSDHEIAEFRILRAARRAHSKLTTSWTSEEHTLAFSGTRLVEHHGIKPWREEGPKKSG